MKIIHLLLLVLASLAFAPLSRAQDSCQDTACQVNSINISTGIDPLTGTPLPPGSGDPVWTLVQVPTISNWSVPRPAFVVGPPPPWLVPLNTQWISGEDYARFGDNNCVQSCTSTSNTDFLQCTDNTSTPQVSYQFERCFCICQQGQMRIDFRVLFDDIGRVSLRDPSGNMVELMNTCIDNTTGGFNFRTPIPVDTTIAVSPGTYCLVVDLYNSNSYAMGFDLYGSITEGAFASDLCCGENLTSAISGVKYWDENCNGVRDLPALPILPIQDPGIPNWIIELYDDNNTLIATTMTDALGRYVFTELAPGTYTVSEVNQPGWVPNTPASGSYTVTIDPFEVVTGLDFGNCESSCSSLNLTYNLSDPAGCCHTLDYLNTGADAVYGISLQALDGVEFNRPDYVVASGLAAPLWTNSGMTIIPAGGTGAPLPASVNALVSNLCLKNVMAAPQYVAVSYLDENYQPFCVDTLVFQCPVEEACLFVLSDTLTCDSIGYKYKATVVNPSGATFPVGYVKLNITPEIPGLSLPEGEGLLLPDTLWPGDTTMVMWALVTEEDLYGDTLCFILSAHDGIEERLCCAEVDTCLAFPPCGPCRFVDAWVQPVEPNQAVECCFNLYITDTLTYDTNLIQAVQTTILTPGVNFSDVKALPALLGGWNTSPPVGGITNDILWTHNSGITPNGVDYRLFEFCLEGTTSTDSVYIEIKWLDADSTVVCRDTVAVFCPYCVTVVKDTLYCDSLAGKYIYTFQVENYSPFTVNAIGIVENPSGSTNIDPDALSIPPIPAYPPGGVSVPVSIAIDVSEGPDPDFCFDLVLRQIIADSIDITCCYATHCIELPPCDSLPPFLCPNPALVSNNICPQVWEPVCGCDSLTYGNLCYALNNGITLWEPGECAGLDPVSQNLLLTAAPGANGGAQLNWLLNASPAGFDFFVLLGRWPGEAEFKAFATVPVMAGQQAYSFLHVDPMPGVNEYQVVAIDVAGRPLYSNIAEVFFQSGLRQVVIYTYPNPATNMLNIVSSQQGPAEIELLSPEGRLILRQEAEFAGPPVQVDISRLGGGLFVARLRFGNGTTGRQRFVKVR